MTDQEVCEYLALNLMFTIEKGCRDVKRPDGVTVSGFRGRNDCERYIQSLCNGFWNPLANSQEGYFLCLGPGGIVDEMVKRGWEVVIASTPRLWTVEIFKGCKKYFVESHPIKTIAVCKASIAALRG